MNIRKNVLQARDALSEEEQTKAAILLTERILGHQWYYRSEILLCFVSYGSEISTRDILAEALKAGKEVYVPKVLRDGDREFGDNSQPRPNPPSKPREAAGEFWRAVGKPWKTENVYPVKSNGRQKSEPGREPKTESPQMAFYRITSLEELREGYRGIPEPSGETQEYIYTPELAERTLMLMPGVAFDRFRNRIGYGKGFYDRYLADKPGLQLRTIAVGHRCQMVEELSVTATDIKPYQVICV